MNAIDLSRFDTVQLVPPTPFTPDASGIIPERLKDLVNRLAGDGIHVFIPAAGTGEFHSLSADEVVECVRATRAGAKADSIVMAPIGLSVEHAVTIGKRSLDAGADALLLMPVIHPYVSDDGFRDYFLSIANRLGRSLITYKRGPSPSDRLLLELAETGKLSGVKYAVNELDAFARFAAAAKKVGNLGLYCGTAERFSPYFMLAGATGYTSGSGAVAPKITLAMHRALAAGQFEESLKWLAFLRPLEDYRAKDADSFNISAVKYAVSLRGLDCGPCRPPQRRLSPQEQLDIQRIVQRLMEEENKLPVSRAF